MLQGGGHLLLRVTQLPACQPADLVPPPSSNSMSNAAGTAAASAAAAAALKDSSKSAAAAAAAAAGDRAAASGSAATGNGSGLTDQVNALLQKTYHDAESQVRLYLTCIGVGKLARMLPCDLVAVG
jgi:hypothetical protein